MLKKIKKKIFLIAEIGINHNGSIKLAKKLIDNAILAGFDAVKFQKRTPAIAVPDSKKMMLRETPWGLITYLEYKNKIEFGRKEYDQIDAYCKKKNIHWFASPWDIPSLNFLKKYKLKFMKIPSAMLTNLELVKEISKLKTKTFISTGMSTLKDIDKVYKIFKRKNANFMLMHTVSTYPCPENKLNLNLIKVLKKRYKSEIGYSGHETSVSPSLVAAAFGAQAIERHITLDRTTWGTDHSASLEFPGMSQLCNLIRKFESYTGDGIKKLSKEEKKKLLDQKYW
jgi:N-acetylneuraminate synthase